MRMPDRIGIIHGVLVIFAIALIAKAAYEQIYRGSYWAAQGQRQHYSVLNLPAPRGEILDERGDTLVESRTLSQVSIAPREVKSPHLVQEFLEKIGATERWRRAAADTDRKWVELPGRFPVEEVAQYSHVAGVYTKTTMERVYANSAGIRRIVGKVDPRTGEPLDGIELMFDEVLQGGEGTSRVARDHRGRRLLTGREIESPQPGNSVQLTINRGLQDITERAISDAVDSLNATGGDIVVLDPHTGNILAMASKRIDPRATANTAITEPYEPGSTLKPFFAADLLTRNLAKSGDIIDTYNGRWNYEGRVITDVHKAQELSLFDVIKYSSNIGIIRFTQRMSHRDMYTLLRDLGFGTPTGVPLPAEAAGTLREPARWSKRSAASLAIGYEIAVTPLQLATAYGAIANGGLLMQPNLIKEIRRPDGTIVHKSRPKPLRRIMPPEIATEIQGMLREVVEGGTGRRASLTTIDIAGKSGTARRTIGGKYVPGAYTASFVGLFPSDNPQYVVVAKLDNPSGAYYGGTVAGSVLNVVLRAAVAARDASLDLQTLAGSIHDPRPDTSPAGVRAALAKKRSDSIRRAAAPPLPVAVEKEPDPRTSSSYVVKLPWVPRYAPVGATVRPVPSVSGLTVRSAVRVLHSAGFRVELNAGTGPLETVPAQGTLWMPGRVVKLRGGQ